MTGAASRLAARIGRRGAALTFFFLLDILICVSLLTAPRPLVPFYAWMGSILPMTAWAAVWGGVGLVCLWFSFRVHDSAGFAAAVGLKVAWGLLSFVGWLTGVDRAWINTVIFLAFAAFVHLIAGGIPAAPPREAGGRWVWTRS